MPRTAKSYYIFDTLRKGKKYYFRAKSISVYGVSSAWSNFVGAVAGDYNAPDAIGPDDVTYSAVRRKFSARINQTWTAPADLKEVWWLAVPRAPEGTETAQWTNSQLIATNWTFIMNSSIQQNIAQWSELAGFVYVSLNPEAEFYFYAESDLNVVYDVFAVPIDIAGNIPDEIEPCVVAAAPNSVEAAATFFRVGGEPYNDFWIRDEEVEIRIYKRADADKILRYAVMQPGEEDYGAWIDTTGDSVTILLTNQGITNFRYYAVDSKYADLQTNYNEVGVKWDKELDSDPAFIAADCIATDRRVRLVWTVGTDAVSGMHGSFIYRNTVDNSVTAQLLTVVPDPGNTWEDVGAGYYRPGSRPVESGKTYYYYLRGSDIAYNLSDPDMVSVVIPELEGPQVKNLIDNSNFERDNDSGDPQGWSGLASIRSDPDYYGNRCARVTSTATVISEKITAAQCDYVISLASKNVIEDGQSVVAVVSYYNEMGELISSESKTLE